MRIPAASPLMSLARPLLFAMDAEDAHHLALDCLARASSLPRVLDAIRYCSSDTIGDERLAVSAMGLRFRNPLGVAAGLDKDAVAIPALAALGFGCVEAGTITPRPQDGNPRPRVFRLPDDGAVINRMGFPSAGADAVGARLAALPAPGCVVGLNVGRNKVTSNDDAAADYADALRRLGSAGDYVAINVSSPNTPGLRALQDPRALRALVERVLAAASGRPVVVKLAPDLAESDLALAIDAALEGGAAGLVLANTTLSRPPTLRGARASEAGGLSGAPLLGRTLELVALARRRAGARAAIVAAGGIASAEDAWRALRAGADLVQIYTAFIYGGPSLPSRILRGLLERLEREGLAGIGELTRAAA